MCENYLKRRLLVTIECSATAMEYEDPVGGGICARVTIHTLVRTIVVPAGQLMDCPLVIVKDNVDYVLEKVNRQTFSTN